MTTPEIALPLQCSYALEENRKGWREDWRKYARVRVDGLDVEEDPSDAAKSREANQGPVGRYRCDDEDLGDVIQTDTSQAVEQRLPDHKEVDTLDELQRETGQQEQFVFINSEGFIKRTGDFDQLDECVKSSWNKRFVLTAEAGNSLASYTGDSGIRTPDLPDAIGTLSNTPVFPAEQNKWAVMEANLETVAGSEQKGIRPVLIVSNEEFNQAMPNVTVLPLTSAKRRLYPSEVFLP